MDFLNVANSSMERSPYGAAGEQFSPSGQRQRDRRYLVSSPSYRAIPV